MALNRELSKLQDDLSLIDDSIGESATAIRPTQKAVGTWSF
jgi:hypothetical protein